jgi:hypothetical protein
MKKKPLQVSLRVSQPSIVELTVGDSVQLDRFVPSREGYLAERHGELLPPGRRTVLLDRGFYFFKTMSEASLKVVHGGVDASVAENHKDPNPEVLPGAPIPPPPPIKGDEPDGEAPSFTVG